jgi:hypothetical protein
MISAEENGRLMPQEIKASAGQATSGYFLCNLSNIEITT